MSEKDWTSLNVYCNVFTADEGILNELYVVYMNTGIITAGSWSLDGSVGKHTCPHEVKPEVSCSILPSSGPAGPLQILKQQ